MKQFVLLLAIALMSCSGGKNSKTTPAGAASLTFNGFAMGTPLDTLVHRLRTKPATQTDDQLYYSNVSAEGVRWKEITYDFVGGQLARVTASQSGQDAGSYRKLYQALTERYGKPTQNVDSLTIWTSRDAELSLQPGSILFARR